MFIYSEHKRVQKISDMFDENKINVGLFKIPQDFF